MVVFGRTGVDPMLEISQRSLAFEKRHLFGDEIDVRFAFRFAVAFLGIRSFADSPDRHDLDVGVKLHRAHTEQLLHVDDTDASDLDVVAK